MSPDLGFPSQLTEQNPEVSLWPARSTEAVDTCGRIFELKRSNVSSPTALALTMPSLKATHRWSSCRLRHRHVAGLTSPHIAYSCQAKHLPSTAVPLWPGLRRVQWFQASANVAIRGLGRRTSGSIDDKSIIVLYEIQKRPISGLFVRRISCF